MTITIEKYRRGSGEAWEDGDPNHPFFGLYLLTARGAEDVLRVIAMGSAIMHGGQEYRHISDVEKSSKLLKMVVEKK